MANDYFRFKKFTIHQSMCAMKVGTDGTLLGAWANGGKHVLDIGTGTGLIALMMAQRCPDSIVKGIDIDEVAVGQARQNVEESIFAGRVSIECCDLADAEGEYDSLVCNPPFFVDSLSCPDAQRSMARHADTLTYASLMENGWRLLSDRGEFSLIIPFNYKSRLESEAILMGFFKTRECAVKTTPTKSPRRYLLAFRKHVAPMEWSELIIGSDTYKEITKDFYL